jgi:hypothetical protein
MSAAERRRLTRFGRSLCDLFIALVIFFAVLGYVFAVAYLFARGVDLAACRPRQGEMDEVACLNAIRASAMPSWLTILNRAAIASSGVLVIGTALGTAAEMNRARKGPRMAVHVPAYSEAWQGPERRSGIERRRGWCS